MLHRHTPHHGSVLLKVNELQFVTVCTKDRRAILAKDEAQEVLLASWEEANHWVVGRYVIMPDHVHLFCSPRFDGALDLARWVNYWKSMCSRAWPDRRQLPLWQESYWDVRMRNPEQYESKWEYVRQNPVRAGLAHVAEGWKFAGEPHVLEL